MIKEKDTINNITTKLGDFWAFRANSGDRVELWLSSYDFDPAIGLYYWNGSKWIIIDSGDDWEATVPPDVSYASPPTSYINTRLNTSGCYYVWTMAASDSYKKTGQYFLEISIK
jgi:hypothetical protein